jgi:hypothetical protein
VISVNGRTNNDFWKGEGEYTCANNKRLIMIKTDKRISKSGYEREVKIYECEDCEGCPY